MCLIMLYMRVPGRVVARCSSRLLCEHREGQGYIQRVVVLDQRRVFVVQDQVFQGAVKVVGLSKSETCGRLVNHTMFDFSFHTVEEEKEEEDVLRRCSSWLKSTKSITFYFCFRGLLLSFAHIQGKKMYLFFLNNIQ